VRKSAECERPREKEWLPRAAALLPCAVVCERAMGVEWSVCDPPPPCICVVTSSLSISNNMKLFR